MINLSQQFKVAETVKKAVLNFLVDGDRPREFTKTEDGKLAIKFNGFIVEDEKVILTLNGRWVAYMDIPRRFPGDTLTIDGHKSMAGTYLVDIL